MALVRADVERALIGYTPRIMDPGPYASAAVLVLLRNGPEGVEAVLTQRSRGLRTHPGEVCFAGGRRDPLADATLVDTALREAREEIGVCREHVTILGRLSDYFVRTGSVISPFVGWLDEAAPAPRIESSNEVFALLRTPIEVGARGLRESAVVLTYASGETKRYPIYRFPVFPLNEDGDVADTPPDLWGATAHMLAELMSLLGVLPEFATSPRHRPQPSEVTAVQKWAFVS